jgi:hypothetical protein
MIEEPPQKRRRGCLFYGCLGGTACLLAVLIAFLLGLYQLKRMLNFYTDTHAVSLPSVQLSAAEMDVLKRRIEDFQDAVRTGRPTEPLSLSADEINAMIGSDPNLTRVKGRVYLTIDGDRLKGQVSLPLDELGLPIFRGRYLNGTGVFAVGLHRGDLLVTADSIVVKNKPLPAVYMDKIRSENLAANLSSNPRASVALNHLQDVRIRDGKLILVPKVEK